jgi:hypothetical protein
VQEGSSDFLGISVARRRKVILGIPDTKVVGTGKGNPLLEK